MENVVCILPRNINSPDTIVYKPVKITWKQVGLLGVGAGISFWCCQLAIPLYLKIALSSLSISGSISVSFVKYKGNHVDELILDSFVYTQRKITYLNMEKKGDFIVNIKARTELQAT